MLLKYLLSGYISDLMDEVVSFRDTNNSYSKANRAQNVPRQHPRPQPLSQSTPKPAKHVVVASHIGRFNRWMVVLGCLCHSDNEKWKLNTVYLFPFIGIFKPTVSLTWELPSYGSYHTWWQYPSVVLSEPSPDKTCKALVCDVTVGPRKRMNANCIVMMCFIETREVTKIQLLIQVAYGMYGNSSWKHFYCVKFF